MMRPMRNDMIAPFFYFCTCTVRGLYPCSVHEGLGFDATATGQTRYCSSVHLKCLTLCNIPDNLLDSMTPKPATRFSTFMPLAFSSVLVAAAAIYVTAPAYAHVRKI